MSRKKESKSRELRAESTPGGDAQQLVERIEPDDPEPKKGDPTYHAVNYCFHSRLVGVRAGEDRTFPRSRVFVDFDDDKPAKAHEKAELKKAGFRVLADDFGFTAIANPQSRQKRDELAQIFTDRRIKENSRDFKPQ